MRSIRTFICAILSNIFIFTTLLASQGGYALDFTGSNYADISSIAANGTFSQTITLECWLKPGNMSLQYYLAYGDQTNAAPVGIATRNDSLLIGNGTDLVSCALLSTNMWNHAALSISSNTATVYLNGKNIKTMMISSYPQNTDKFYIGANTDLSIYANGNIDEVRVWETARSQSDIITAKFKELSGSESGLLAYYDLNEGMGSMINDACGANNATLYNNPDWSTSGCLSGPRQALEFDGLNDYVDFGLHNSLQITGDVTVECWANFDQLGQQVNFLIQGIGGTDASSAVNSLYIFKMMPNNTLESFWEYGKGTNEIVVSTVPADIEINEWHHYTLVRDVSAKTVSFYVDGKELGDTQTYLNDATDGAEGVLQIGAESYTSTNYEFDGKMDEVRIWNKVRTPSEIRESMMRTLDANETGLVGYFRFDETEGALAAELVSGETADLINMTTESAHIGSDAFNTWLGGISEDWSTAGNWSRGSVPVENGNVGLYHWNDLAYEAGISFYSALNNLYIGAGLTNNTLGSYPQINNNLILSSDVDLFGKRIYLDTTAYLIEDTGYLTGTNGYIRVARPLNNISEDISGLGIEISSSADLGITTVIRRHSNIADRAIFRNYQITPTNNSGLNATLTFHYRDEELNGVAENTLQLYSSSDGETWTEEVSAIRDADANTLTISGVDALSYWTAAPEGYGESTLSIITAEAPAAGDGSLSTPYQIATPENLLWISENSDNWDKYFIQVENIDASLTQYINESAGLSPIGNSSHYFTGSYDGQGYSIDNLYISAASASYIGLFGYLSGAELTEVALKNVNVTGNLYTGALAGYVIGSTITNCSSSGNITGIWRNAGGLVGSMGSSSVISGCYSTCSVLLDDTNCGGLVGYCNASTIEYSYSDGDIEADDNNNGGLVGYLTSGSTVSNCYSKTSVLPDETSYFSAGLIGRGDNSFVEYSYSCGRVSDHGDGVGGMIGTVVNMTINNSFWDMEASGISTSQGGIGKTTEEMKTASTYISSSWDFTSIWDINSLHNDNYPYLQDHVPSDTPLPITLVSFTGKPVNGTVELAWETASETNNARFLIYRNGEAIASVEGAGTSSQPHSYALTDKAVVPGMTYTYVLADVDYANKLTKHEAKAVTVTIGNDLLEADFMINSAFPNPFNPSVTISYELSSLRHVQASVYNVNGELISRLLDSDITAGSHELVWHAANMPSGVYILKMLAGDLVNTRKLVLMK